MLQGEHSAIHLTFIKLPFVIKIFVLSIFEWPLKTGFTVSPNVTFLMKAKACLINFSPVHSSFSFSFYEVLCVTDRERTSVDSVHVTHEIISLNVTLLVTSYESENLFHKFHSFPLISLFQLLSSPLCNRQGTFECGQCTCDPGRYGKKCECDGSQSTSDESLKKCIK